MARNGRKKLKGLSADLSDWEVEEAWLMWRSGYTQKQVAERYKISVRTLQRIFDRREQRNGLFR